MCMNRKMPGGKSGKFAGTGGIKTDLLVMNAMQRVLTKKQNAKLAAEEAARVEGERQAVIKAQSDVAGANTAAIADRTVASEQAGAGYIGGDGPTVAVPTNPSGDPLDQTGGARKQQYGSGYNSGVSL